MYYYLPSVSLVSLAPKILQNGKYSGQISKSLQMGDQQQIEFSIRGNLLTLYLDEILCQSNLILPVENKVFTIHYYLPPSSATNSEILAFISELTFKSPR